MESIDEMSSAISTTSAVAGTMANGSPIGGNSTTRGSFQAPSGCDSRSDPLTSIDNLSVQDADDTGRFLEPPAVPMHASVHPIDSLGKSSYTSSSEASGKNDHIRQELAEKDSVIGELRETVQILEMKVQKLEQLVRLKDGKIQTLVAKLRSQKPQA